MKLLISIILGGIGFLGLFINLYTYSFLSLWNILVMCSVVGGGILLFLYWLMTRRMFNRTFSQMDLNDLDHKEQIIIDGRYKDATTSNKGVIALTNRRLMFKDKANVLSEIKVEDITDVEPIVKLGIAIGIKLSHNNQHTSIILDYVFDWKDLILSQRDSYVANNEVVTML